MTVKRLRAEMEADEFADWKALSLVEHEERTASSPANETATQPYRKKRVATDPDDISRVLFGAGVRR